MADVLQWPIIPRPVPLQLRLPQRDPNVVVSPEDQEREKRRQLLRQRHDFTHALHQLILIGQLHGEEAWAVRVVETALAEAKAKFLEGDRNVDSK